MNKKTKLKSKFFGTNFLNFFDKICFNNLIFNKDRKKFVQLANEIIDKKMSVEYLINSMSNVEKLKFLVLNEEQKEYFQSMPKFDFQKHFENIFIQNHHNKILKMANTIQILKK